MPYRVFIYELCASPSLDPDNLVRGDTRSYPFTLGPGLTRTLGRLRCRVGGAEVTAPPLSATLAASKDVYRFVRPSPPSQVLVDVAHDAASPSGQMGDLLIGWCRTGADSIEEETAVAPRMRWLVPTPGPESETEQQAVARGEAFMVQNNLSSDDYAIRVEQV